MKTCFKCGAEKPLVEFYKHKKMADGYLGKCKACTKSDVKKHRAENIEKIRAYDRLRGSRQDAGYAKRYRDRFPKKYKAKTMVNNAIRDGRMKKEDRCSNCNAENPVGHHDDYDYPLTVRWLCQACHKQWHAENGPGANGV